MLVEGEVPGLLFEVKNPLKSELDVELAPGL